jgi:hypothetical protein
MDDAQFDALTRMLGHDATRRGVLGVALIGGLAGVEGAARRRRRSKKRRAWSENVAAQSLTGIEFGCPEDPAQSIAILSAFYPGYWWDHTDLTVAVQAHPNAKPDLIAAAREAIVIWNDTLAADPALSIITLSDVTGVRKPAHKADIVLHYVPHAGGTVFGGYAICGEHKCNNVIVRSDLPKPLDRDPYTPEYLGWVTLHELGHALGLGHAEPLEDTNDLMGYGWPPLDPVLSECDLRGLRTVFAWAIDGTEPAPPTVASVDCSDLC